MDTTYKSFFLSSALLRRWRLMQWFLSSVIALANLQLVDSGGG